MRVERAGGVAYMVKRPDGVLAITRGGWASSASARKSFIKSLKRPRPTWLQCYRRGCRVVLVDVKELRR